MTAGSGGIGGLPPVGAGVCQPDEADCAISHATTGWCLQATGAPVIVVTRWECEPNDATPTVTMIDPSTGAVVPNQVVVPCAGKDWEIVSLCDFDTLTGDVIAAVTQIFQWDDATGALTVSLVRADDPTGPPYVVQGVLRQCAVPTWVDVETSIVCGNTAGTLRQLTQMIVWDTRNGLLLSAFYLNASGAVTALNPGETVTVGDCWTPTLPAILDELEDANVNLTDVNSELDSQTLLLTDIEANTDGIEPLLTAIDADTSTLAGAVKIEDTPVVSGQAGIPALARRNDNAVATTNLDGDYTHIATDAAGRVGVSDLGGSLTVDGTVSVGNFPASVEVSNDIGNPLLVSGSVSVSNFPASVEISNDVGNPIPVNGTVNVGNFPTEFCCTATNTKLDTIIGQNLTLIGHVDGVEGLLTAITGQLTVVIGHVDGIEGLLTALNALVTAGNASLTTLVAATKLEDAAHVSGDRGVFALGVRNDTNAVRTSADGDYSPISVDSAGRLKVVTDADACPPFSYCGSCDPALTYVQAAVVNATVDTLLYTVPVGKVLHVTSLSVDFDGDDEDGLIIRDGAGGAVRQSWRIGKQKDEVHVHSSFNDPLRFTSAVYLDLVFGSNYRNANVSFVGRLCNA